MTSHVKRGEAIFIDLQDGERTIQRIAQDSSNLLEQAQRVEAPERKTRAAEVGGRNYKPFGGQPCEICGRTDFKTLMAFEAHRNSHARWGDAKWLNGQTHGPGKQLIVTKKGREKYGDKALALPNKDGSVVPQVQVEAQLEVIEEPHQPAYNDVVASAFTELQRAVSIMQMAVAMQTMSPERASQIASQLTQLGALPMGKRH